jgi:outer membrane biosynthesis protein TonB
LQPRPNNDLRQIPSEKKKGIVGTLIIHGVLLILLIVVAFTPPKPPEFEEGIMVNFGTDETGIGMIEPSPPPVQEEASVPPPVAATKVQKEEALLTQNNEEAPEVKKVDPEAEKKKLEKIEADRKIREQAETERKRLEQKEIERKRIEADQKRQADIRNKTRDALANSKNAGTTSTSEGEAGGKGNQGVQTGSVDSKNRGDGSGLGNSGNISYSLGGRRSQLLPIPKYDYQDEGKVVVEISVDRSGKVIQATPGSKGSSTLNEYLLKVAKEAALKARFDAKPDAPAVQKGTIIYIFVLK